MSTNLKKWISNWLAATLLLFNISTAAYGQDSPVTKKPSTVNVIEIDPRQYITVLYNKYQTRRELDTIWNWETRKNVPQQKYNTLDIAGEVKICFDKESLIENTNFFGNISLEAEISGPKGTRQIEVNPYSEIGVTRKSIGIKSDPPADVASKLLNIIKELSEADVHKRNLDSVIYSNSARADFRSYKIMLDTLIRRSKNKNANTAQIISDYLFTYRQSPTIPFAYLTTAIPLRDQMHNNPNRETLSSLLEDIEADDILDFKFYQDQFLTKYTNALNFIQDKLPLTILYLNSFDRSGQEGLKALLSLTNLDIIKYNQIESGLVREQDTLSKLNLSLLSKTNDLKDSILSVYSDPIKKAINSLYNLSLFRGSEIERIIVSFGKSYVSSNPGRSTDTSFNLDPTRYGYKQKLINLINNYPDELAILVAKKAGEQIYKKLIFATIDVGKNGAANGETLSLYLTWILDSSDSLGNSPRLQIGKYNLSENGWKPQIADIFSLINRIHPSATIDPTNNSPSNFKGSGGATLMLSYLKEDKGLNIFYKRGNRPEEDQYYTRRKNYLLNFLQPSVGLNVSYLDFNTTKDVEIGVGLQLGLFGNKIYFGYGLNLMLLNPKDAPYYFFLGFSFAKLSDLFKDSNKISSSN